MTQKIEAPTAGGKIMLAALLCAVLAMFAGSFLYRMQGHGLSVPVSQGDGMGDPMRAMMGVDVNQLRAQIKQAKEHPEDAEVQLTLGKTFMMMQAWDKALEYLRVAQKDAPNDLDVLRALGVTRFQLKDYAQAQQAFARVLQKAPDDAATHYNIGILLKHYLKRPAEGDAHFRRAIQLGSDDPEVVKGAQDELAATAAK